MTTYDEPAFDLFEGIESGAAPRPPSGVNAAIPQWKVGQIQLVNWGGFDVPATVDLDPHSTLLSGASGSGKSTLLDAYTAVMMPSDTPFNGASNETAGRARGAEQRTVVSYVRGQTDVNSNSDGDEVAHVLRGQKTDAWGGVAIVFVDDHGKKFTAARLYYVPATARLGSDVTMRMLTVDGHLVLRDVEPLARDGFAPQKLRALISGLSTHDTYQAFSARLFTRLGIGANGDGNKALELLAFVQAGAQFRTVDALYKQTVLERPGTYTKADKALVHFDHLADTYRTMQDEYRKASILRHIPEYWQKLTDARATLTTVDRLGHRLPGVTPMSVWAADREADLLVQAEASAYQQHKSTTAAHDDAELAAASADRIAEKAQQAYARAGGNELAELNRAIQQAEHDAATRLSALSRLTDDVAALLTNSTDLSDRAHFDALRAHGEVDFADVDATRKQVGLKLQETAFRLRTMDGDLKTADADLQRLEATGSRIPARIDQMRAKACERAGLPVSKAPFLAELIGVNQDELAWQEAIEKVLGPAATRMLVPDELLDEFQRSVNDLRLGGELRFDGATAGMPEPSREASNTTAGKLDFAPSPYRGWVMRRVASDTYNAICVDSPADLGRGGFRVTREGQVRRGRSGSLGRRPGDYVLGFSNEDLVEAAKDTVRGLQRDIADAKNLKDLLEQEYDCLDKKAVAHRILERATFDTIDVREARDREATARVQRDTILTGDSILSQLKSAADAAKATYKKTVQAAALLGERKQNSEDAWKRITERRDGLTTFQDAVASQRAEVLTGDVGTYLDEQFLAVCAGGDPDDLDAFGARIGQLRKSLTEAQSKAASAVARASEDIVAAFKQYLDQFDDPTLSPSLSAYSDFARILEEINTRGLQEQREVWRAKVMKWSGEHLFLLHQEMSSAVADIEARLIPINDILRRLSFGPTDSRLQMRMRKVRRDEVSAFLKHLRTLSSGATVELDDHKMEARFKELESFMARLRSHKDPNFDPKLSQRDDLLDVRKHVEVLAERQSKDGYAEATYTSLGSKSGGETQELIAFIVGSALRFRLGDDEGERPRFAPVFLDEGFIKADAQFASRAVNAWTGLGFQLVVGAPMDKYAALEPHMRRFLLVTKNQATKRSTIRAISDWERATARTGS
ncbi:ATP-binding protein [Oerskovia paurometabola]|uniref:ATP-binding protein n=1 Tax=Oerskovia paurometabola TaxID=162170 RepID=UPI00382A5030